MLNASRANTAPWTITACLTLALLGTAIPAGAAFPPESRPPLKKAMTAADEGDWATAIDAYTDHLRKLEPRHYRDKKTYSWILEKYQEANPEAGLGDFEKLVRTKLDAAREADDSTALWRLHHILAETAKKRNDAEQRQKHLTEAIRTYPDQTYSTPSKLSRLHHLYNEAAILRARNDFAKGEDYFVEAFKADTRFVHVFLPTWQRFYASADAAARLPALTQRLIDACDRKAEQNPNLAEAMRKLKAELKRELQRLAGGKQ